MNSSSSAESPIALGGGGVGAVGDNAQGKQGPLPSPPPDYSLSVTFKAKPSQASGFPQKSQHGARIMHVARFSQVQTACTWGHTHSIPAKVLSAGLLSTQDPPTSQMGQVASHRNRPMGPSHWDGFSHCALTHTLKSPSLGTKDSLCRALSKLIKDSAMLSKIVCQW